jgi:hypothetical protein
MIGGRRPMAVLAIAALVGGCVAGPAPSVPPVLPPSASTASTPLDEPASTSPSPAASPGQTGDWRLATLPDPTAVAVFTDVVAGSDGFLVAGGGGPVGTTPIVLNSLNGKTWSTEAIESTFAAPSALTTVGARVFAFGGGETSKCAHPSSLMTWARAPTGSWREAPFDNVFCNGPGNAGLVEFDRHLVLAGAGVGDQSFYLTSEDGLHWTDSGLNPFGDVYPRAILAHDPDLWIFASAPDGRPVVVHRSAGQAFARPQAIAGLGPDASILAAVWLDGPVVVASSGRAVGIMRPDGAGSWVGVPAVGLPADEVARIQVADGHILALGSTEAAVPEAWSSADGSTWQPIELPAEARLGGTVSGVAIVGGTAVLVGQMVAPDGTGAIGAIWTGPATLLAP